MKIRSIGLEKLSSLPSGRFAIKGAKVLCSIAAARGMLASIEMYHTGLPKLNPLIRFKVTVILIGSMASHLIVNHRIVYITIREIDLSGIDVECDDGGIVYNASGIHDLNKRAVVAVAHRSRLEGRGREFLARRPGSNTPDGRKIDGS